MFKRVVRRQKRKEEEEDLGLNEEMKEVMGLQDTDSSESDSSSDDDSSDEERGTMKSLSMKRKRNAGSDEEDKSDDASGSEAEVGDNEVAEDQTDDEELIGLGDVDAEEDSSDDEPLMTVSQALKDPLYLVSMDPEIRACVVCPGKMLKNPKMIEIHISSNAHKRRFKRLRELAMAASPDVDVGDVLVELEKEKDSKPSREAVAQSKRADKRRAKQTALRAKRLRQKEAKAKAAARKKEKQALKGEKTSLRNSTSPAPKEKKPEEDRKVAKEKKQDGKTVSPTKRADKKSRPRYFDEVKSVETKPSNANQGKKMKGSPKKKNGGHGSDKLTPKSAEKQRSKKRPKPNQAELQVFD